MRTSQQIREEIQATLGFFPPFFSPALNTPQILENLWQQTLLAYIHNPLPALFKEKLSAYLARFCAVPYCMICHSCTLYLLGMEADEILALLEFQPPIETEIQVHLERLATQPDALISFPSANSPVEESVLCCAIFIALEQDQTQACRTELQRVLGKVNYQYLITFIAYIKTCSTWMEAHPEISYLADQRVRKHLSALIASEPRLLAFFEDYQQRVECELQNRAEQLLELTERRRKDQELRESEQRLHLALEAAQMGIWEWNFLTGEEIWSPETEELFGLEPGTFTKTHADFLSRVHPDDFDRLQQKMREMLQFGRYEMEFRIIRADNQQTRWLVSKGQVMYDPTGVPTRVLGVTQDTTDRKRAEEYLRESEERFRLVADSAPVLLWMAGNDGSYTFFNQSWLAFTGRALVQEIGDGWMSNIHPNDVQRCLDVYRSALQTRQDFQMEYRLKHVNGEYRWMLSTAKPWWTPTGNLAGYIGSCVDIHDRKQSEENLRFMQTMTQAIFESKDFYSALTIALQKVCESTQWDLGEAWVPNHDRTALVSSPSWYSKSEKLVEFRQQSEQFSFPPGVGLPGRIWQSRSPEWCRDVSVMAKTKYLRSQMALSAGLKAALGIPILADNEVITVLVFYMFEAREEDQRLIDLIAASTELGVFILRKQAEEQLQNSLREKEVLLKEIHHRVKNNLQMVSSLLKLQASSIQDPNVVTSFQESQSRVRAMALIHERLYQSDSLAKIYFPEYVYKLTTDLVRSYSNTPAAIQLQVDVADVDLDVDTIIPCGLIINELVSNAIKYAFPHQKEQTIEICFHSTPTNQYQLTVTDNGIGLPPEFDFRNTTSLGLQLVCSLAHQLQGTIAVDCTSGTSFSITFAKNR